MLRLFMLFFIFCGGLFTIFTARAADGCEFVGGDIYLGVPQMSIPADTPDGTVLYSSPKITKKISCHADNSTYGYYIDLATTSDFNAFLRLRNGIKFTLYIDGVAYDREMTNSIGYIGSGINQSFSKTVSIWFDIKVDSSRGKIPVSGTYLSGGFQSLFLMFATRYDLKRGVIGLSTPNITYIPCTMEISVNPETIDFGGVKISDLDKGIKFQRRFTTLIQKSKGCTLAVSAPFGINMYFEPTVSTLNADGSLDLNNGLGLSIADTSGKYISYNTAWKINDVKVESVLKNNFTANLQKISGQDVKTGPFSADVVVRIDYY